MAGLRMTETGTYPSFLVGPPNDGLRQERNFARVLGTLVNGKGGAVGKFASRPAVESTGLE